jgi:hypothetical protein
MGGYSSEVSVLHSGLKSNTNVADEMDKVIGDLSHFEIAGEQVLVGVYVRPTKAKSGLILTGTGKDVVEDIFQGKVVRVLKLGPQAFAKYEHEWPGGVPKVGDWLFCRPNDAFQISLKCPGGQATDMFDDIQGRSTLGGWPCRLVFGADVYGRISDPQIVA